MKHHLRIRRDGIIEWLKPPPVMFHVEHQSRKRFSEITPVNPFLFIAFRIIRVMFGEGKGMVPEWTRRWQCHWEMRILSTGYTARSNNRDALIEIEQEMFCKPRFDI